MALLAGPGQRDHAAGPARRRLRRDGEPRRERPGRPPPDQAGAHHVHLSRGGDQGHAEQKAAFRRAVNRAHAQVYSTDESPVYYNAFDNDLQLWVGACLYKGARRHLPDVRRRDGRRDRRAALSRGHAARHHAAGADGDVARRTGPRSTGTGRSRWRRCTSTTPCANTSGRSRRAGCAASSCRLGVQRALRQFQSVDHDRLSAATVPRRDAAGLGCRQAAPVRPH